MVKKPIPALWAVFLALLIGLITACGQIKTGAPTLTPTSIPTNTVEPTPTATPDPRLEIYQAQVARVMALGDAPLPAQPEYDCFIDAYQKRQGEVLLQPLPSEIGEFGERIYHLKLSNGDIIPVRVYSLGDVSYAPGEALAETLEAIGTIDPIVFTDHYYEQLKEMEIWVFTQGTHLSVEEAIELKRRFPVTYPVDGKRGQVIEASMLARMHNGSPVEEEIIKTYHDFRDLQYKHDDVISNSLLYFLEQGYDHAAQANGICGEYAAGLWQKKINEIKELRAHGEMQTPFQGSMQWYTGRLGWEEGDWGMVMYLHLDPELAYSGADPLYMRAGNRISYFVEEGGNEVPSFYPYTRVGDLPIFYHELTHTVVGPVELYADEGALALLHRALVRWQNGDFRADLVVIDNKTGLPLAPPEIP
jgi:hypothetical protein